VHERYRLIANTEPAEVPRVTAPGETSSRSWESVREGSRDVATLRQRLDELERELIVEALARTQGNRARAARILGVTERVMGLRVRKYGIDARAFRRHGRRRSAP